MDWFEYSCCGHTFSRLVRKPAVESTCPRCRQQVKPLVSLHVKKGRPTFELGGGGSGL